MGDVIQYDIFGNIVPQKLCKCGCGNPVYDGNDWINGHNITVEKHIVIELQGIENIDYVVSHLNGKRYRKISEAHVIANGLKDMDEYRDTFPDGVLTCTDVQIKREATTLEKYGVKNAAQLEEFKDKTKETNLKKYGVEYTFQSDEQKLKTLITCMEKYGVENVSQLPEIQEKIKITCLERYGTERPAQSKLVQDKMMETNLSRLGVKYPMLSDRVKCITIENNLEKYGVEYPAQLKEIVMKTSATARGIDLETEDWPGFAYELDPNRERPYLKSERCCIKLNKRFDGSHGHHILYGVIIYIPAELHKSISHNMKTGKNMELINELAFQYLNSDSNV